MDNPIRIICPKLSCRTLLSVPGSARGKSIRCKACGTKIRVPMPRIKQDTATPASEAEGDASKDQAA